MQCPTCSDHPKLKKSQLSSDTPANCYSCGWKLHANKEYLSCSSCTGVKLCSLCKICPQGHYINKAKVLNKTGSPYHSTSYVCDNCKKPATPSSEGVWHCVPCQFDLCDECLPS